MLLNSSEATSVSGALQTSVAWQNDTQYLAEAVVLYGGTTPYLIDSITERQDTGLNLGAFGMFLVVIMTILFIFVAFLSISLMIVLVPIPLLLGTIMHLIIFPLPIAIGIEAAAIILAFIVGN